MDHKPFDVISFGDATIDTFINIHDAEVMVSKNQQEKRLSISWGDKLAVDSIDHQVAGNAANNAVGSARLGLKTAIYVNVGDDDSGEKIARKLKNENVDTSYVDIHHGIASNYSVVLGFQGERTIFVYHQPWTYHLPRLPKSKWVYMTSMSKTFSAHGGRFYDEIADYLKAGSVKLAYNPGTYQLNYDVKEFPEILKLCTLFVVNKEEAKRVLEIDEGKDVPVKDLMKQLKNLGPKMIVVTDGRLGSYTYDGEHAYYISEFPGDRVEATGAGDSYATATVAGLIYGEPLQEAMVWGAINSASVAHEVGPMKGLLTKHELLERRHKLPKFKAKEI